MVVTSEDFILIMIFVRTAVKTPDIIYELDQLSIRVVLADFNFYGFLWVSKLKPIYRMFLVLVIFVLFDNSFARVR